MVRFTTAVAALVLAVAASASSVTTMLEHLELEDLGPVFQRNGIDEKSLALLDRAMPVDLQRNVFAAPAGFSFSLSALRSHDRMQQLGISAGAQLRIENYLKEEHGGGGSGGAAEAGRDEEAAVEGVLHSLGMSSLIPSFRKRAINDLKALMLLDHETMAQYMPEVEFGDRLKILDFIASHRSKEAAEAADETSATSHTQPLDRGQIAEVFADLLVSHDQKRTDKTETGAIVAGLLEENNARLLDQVSEMIAASQRQAISAPPPPAAAKRRAQTAGAGGGSSGANTDHASLWLEDDDGKLNIGANADTDLYRAGAGVLATSGAWQVGEAPDLQCSAENLGVLRWWPEKQALQVCGKGEKWRAAGGAVLDAADEEPCTSETPGALQWDNADDKKLLQVCEGTDTYLNVVTAPGGPAAAPWTILSTDVTNAAGWTNPEQAFCSPGPSDGCGSWHSDSGVKDTYVQVETTPFLPGTITVKSIGASGVWSVDDEAGTGYYELTGSADGSTWFTLAPRGDWKAWMIPDTDMDADSGKWRSLAPDVGAVAHVRLTKVRDGTGPWMGAISMRSRGATLLEAGAGMVRARGDVVVSGGVQVGYATICGPSDAGKLRWLQSRTPASYEDTTGAGVLQPVVVPRNT